MVGVALVHLVGAELIVQSDSRGVGGPVVSLPYATCVEEPLILSDFELNASVVTTLVLPRPSLCVFNCPAPNVYAVIRCESNSVRSRVFKEEGNLEFNLRAIFYRRYPGTHISIEVRLVSPGSRWTVGRVLS